MKSALTKASTIDERKITTKQIHKKFEMKWRQLQAISKNKRAKKQKI